MNGAARCCVCNEGGHKTDRCPELLKELQPGFYKPAGGMPQGGGDDDDEHLQTRLAPLFAVFIKNNTGCDRYIERPHDSILANGDNRCVKSL
jgi:hypothetical protein